ncbi:glycoside hydrolase family 88/105 protein [Crossiella cryophila]|uniref:Unsaturated rhamnogalacturonyl hydrolase n=1 Tax=Crossiella cryophila TaxID=43355 RepID=A0A7W7CGH9_9PSEU|nr:glycoside hydrolase family 88 protein [Crossiella cryophila]MBB4680803.1 unsaturated rhamnogalacturonyl hydrolase [Crossiella cryophila]
MNRGRTLRSRLFRVATAVATAGALALSLTAPVASAAPPATDWSKAVIDSTIARNPDPQTIGGWGYTRGLFLYGVYKVYQRLKDPKYLAYIKKWADYHVDANGHVNHSFNNLDAMQPGNVLIFLHKETGDPRYKAAADQIRTRITTYPRTPDGGMWHATSKTNELWADGVFMAQPFLMRYGQAYGDEQYATEEVLRNLETYFNRLKADNGLMWHAYDGDRDAPWDPKPKSDTGTTSFFWARAFGWSAITYIEILDMLPKNHPKRQQLIGYVQHLAKGLARYQDRQTGRWFQVVDRGDDPDNWTETSASSMYTTMLDAAVQRGYISRSYQRVADRGYRGVLAKVRNGADGLTNIYDISEGTNVGDLNYYYARKRNTNDLHGLGAFLLMQEQLHP